MRETQSGILKGLERKVVLSRLRAAVGLRLELLWLLDGLEIPSGSLCLEIGTGFGWGALGLVQRNDSIKVIATDYDRTVLPMARAYLSQHGAISHVAFCQADAKSLPFLDGAFDLVLALYVLHHVFGYRRALGEIGRVTKPGGRFLFIDPVRIPLMPRFRDFLPPEGLPSRKEFSQFLEEAGFHIERWRGLPVWAFVVSRKEKG
jgi:SAM-dependent methyltransferase